jgi:diguanylate cyclase (GGDEF)-like protein
MLSNFAMRVSEGEPGKGMYIIASMALDPRTMVVVLALSSLLMTVALAFGIRAGRDEGLVRWNLGLGLAAAAWFLIAMREVLPARIAIAAADSLLVAGYCLQLGAIRQFGGRATPRLLLYAPGALLFIVLLPLLNDYPALALVAGLSCAAPLAAIGTAALKLGPGGGRARWMLAIACDVCALVVALRASLVWLAPETHPGLFAGPRFDELLFVSLFATIVASSVAFLLMHHERAEQQLGRVATLDALTEVSNRAMFLHLAEGQLGRARRMQEACAMLMLGLDRLDDINGRFGTAAGDRVLREVVDVLRATRRPGDIMGRYGGVQFCMLLPGTSLAGALEQAERLRAAIAVRPLGGLPQAVTVSVGAAACDFGGPAPLSTAIGRAEEALREAKNGGRNRVAAGGPPAAALGR